MIEGFVTRGRGISIHRVDCADFQDLARKHPERVIPAEWGEKAHDTRNALYQVDINVQASDRQGLLRDILEVLSREKLNVIAVNTLTKKGTAYMRRKKFRAIQSALLQNTMSAPPARK